MIPEKVLYINLSDKSYSVKTRRDLFERYIGGSGVGIKILLEECRKETDPLSAENPIVFAVGPLTGLFPFASKTVAMFKSPITGNLGESHAGGRSAVALRMAGYGAVVIKGASESPVYLSIHENKVYFRDASALWGVGSSYTVGRILRERESEPGLRTIIRIGGAGEKLVRFACVTTETYRHFGRLGLGAVFGSKKLKAVVIAGNSTIEVENQKEYKELYEKIYRLAMDSKLMKKYHDLGTGGNVMPLNALKALPTKNLSQPDFEDAVQISGETLAQNFLGRRVACAHCPTACIHLAALREPYEDEPYFYKTTMISYDHELIYALGSMLGIGRAEHLLKLIDAVEKVGLDAITTGVLLAWATEMSGKAKISEKETIVPLVWGDHLNYIRAVGFIAKQPNQFYKDMAMGVEHASSIYGGKEFALAFGKNEMAGYNTGPLFYATLLTGARHSHLDSAGYSFDQQRLKREQRSIEEGAEILVKEESWRCVLTSLAVCLFARGIYEENLTKECLNVAGLKIEPDTLTEKGFEILKMKHEFKKEMGFDWKNMRIPERIFETETPSGRIKREELNGIVEAYFRMLME